MGLAFRRGMRHADPTDPPLPQLTHLLAHGGLERLVPCVRALARASVGPRARAFEALARTLGHLPSGQLPAVARLGPISRGTGPALPGLLAPLVRELATLHRAVGREAEGEVYEALWTEAAMFASNRTVQAPVEDGTLFRHEAPFPDSHRSVGAPLRAGALFRRLLPEYL